jgi:hypothetical protein
VTPGDAEAGAYRVNDVEALDGEVRFCLVLPCEAVSVPVMRRVLGGTLLGFGADEECVADLLLAATEACTNVLKHDPRSGEYEVSASVSRDDCLLEIANVSAQTIRDNFVQPTVNAFHYRLDRFTLRWAASP